LSNATGEWKKKLINKLTIHDITSKQNLRIIKRKIVFLFRLFDKLTVELDKDHLLFLEEYDEDIVYEEQQHLLALMLLKIMMKNKMYLQM